MSDSRSLNLRQGDVVAKKYEVDGPLGAGPLGSTYLAHSLQNGRKVVIKLLSGPAAPEAQAQDIVAKLQGIPSDALVKVLDTGEHHGRRWIAMEHFEGDSLRRLMDEYAGQKKPFTLQEACQITAKVVEALEAAHAAGLVHRHLRPGNILVQSRSVGPGQGRTVRTIKVTGLGLSELVHPGVLQEGLAERPSDARYLAPELSSPSQGGGASSDLYSAGVVFYELLCGQTPMGTYLAPSQIREDLPKHVDDIVDIAIAANAEDRYPTARDMINDIQRAFQDEDKPVAGLSKKTLAVVIGGTLAIFAIVGGVLAVTDEDKSAARKDEALRAQVAKESPLPDADFIKQKLTGHEDMVYVPEGSFIRGRLNAEMKSAPATEPVAQVMKSAGFYIDRFEWENQKGGKPLVNVTWQQAEELCQSKGKRLCTAEEWERACKGMDNATYAYARPENAPYGYADVFDAAKCGPDVVGDADRDGRGDRASGELADCRSGWGVYDMSGGPREWTSTGGRNNKNFKQLKGGDAGKAAVGSRCAFVDDRNPNFTDRSISFRCCLGDGEASAATPAAPAAPAEGAPAPEGTAGAGTPAPQ